MTTVAMTGGCIISRRFSDCHDDRFRDLVEVLRGADVSFSHLEGTVCSPDTPEAYPAAEAGWTWLRNPPEFAEELRWAGFDLVSHASNHSMDYLYGGLRSTWQALTSAGLPYAGTGATLSQARQPAYLKQDGRTIALVSSSSSTPDWARAADPIHDQPGRPGINQLRTLFRVGPEEGRRLREQAVQMGWWLVEVGNQFLVNPPGLHNTVTRYQLSDQPGMTLVADDEDVAANLRNIREAKRHADLVIFHIHNHEWDPDHGLSAPPPFTRALARACVDAGADIFIAEGAHAMLRGIEIYQGKPIFYDPGDLFKDGNSKTRPLSSYYWVQGRDQASGEWTITTADTAERRDLRKLPVASHPVGGYNTSPVHGVVVPVCTFDDQGRLTKIVIYPASHLAGSPEIKGLPGLETGDQGTRIIEYLRDLSAPYGTTIEVTDGRGEINL